MSSGISLSRLSYDIKSFKLLGAHLSMRTHTLQSTSVTDSVKKMLSFSSYSFYCFEFMSCYFVVDVEQQLRWFTLYFWRFVHHAKYIHFWYNITLRPFGSSCHIISKMNIFSMMHSPSKIHVNHCLILPLWRISLYFSCSRPVLLNPDTALWGQGRDRLSYCTATLLSISLFWSPLRTNVKLANCMHLSTPELKRMKTMSACLYHNV